MLVMRREREEGKERRKRRKRRRMEKGGALDLSARLSNHLSV
jgi:hypothetical protein